MLLSRTDHKLAYSMTRVVNYDNKEWLHIMNHYGNAEIHLICKFNPMESYWLGKYLDCNSRVIKYHNRANVRLASGYSLFEC